MWTVTAIEGLVASMATAVYYAASLALMQADGDRTFVAVFWHQIFKLCRTASFLIPS
jgi:hypothetical protein